MGLDDDKTPPRYSKHYKAEVDKLLDIILRPGDSEVPFYCPVHGKHLVTPLGGEVRRKDDRPRCAYCKAPMQTQEEHDLNGNLRQMRRRAVNKAWNYLEGDH